MDMLRLYTLDELMHRVEADLEDPTPESLADVREVRAEVEWRAANSVWVRA